MTNNQRISVLADSDCLLTGLAFTSRTETVEDYLKDKVRSLTVIALSSCFLKENLSSCRVYQGGVLKKEFRIPNFRIPDYSWYRQPLILLVFIAGWFSVISAALRARKRFDLCIGISHSFGFAGVLLKKMGRARRLVYYCIDYYNPEKKITFNSFFVRLINIIERFILRNADFLWELSGEIGKQRRGIKGCYRSSIVPLGYSRQFRKMVPFEEINRWDIGFVGTVSGNHGLELVVKAMPEIIKRFPAVKVRIIGQGPFLEELKGLAAKAGLSDYFVFYGFIKDEARMLDILSHCAIALSIYTKEQCDNITCADTGKPKLYALRGLPMIVSEYYIGRDAIEQEGAGRVIRPDTGSIVAAVFSLLGNDDVLRAAKLSAFKIGERFLSDSIFDRAFREMEI